jgi:hypothetical protein
MADIGDLDRYVKIGTIMMPRWLAARDALDGEFDEPQGYIVHQSEPRFTARWCIGDPAGLPGLTYADVADPGEDDRDNLTLYDFVWIDDMPDEGNFRLLMRKAVVALDNFIQRLNGEYE